jgi:hypothetical protein
MNLHLRGYHKKYDILNNNRLRKFRVPRYGVQYLRHQHQFHDVNENGHIKAALEVDTTSLKTIINLYCIQLFSSYHTRNTLLFH